jgi:hypothetical protein
MINNTPYSQKNNKPTGQAKTLVGIRGGAFYGLQYEKVKTEPSSYKRGIVVCPNFYFYDNFTKVIVDFSDYKNEVEQQIIDEYFTLSLSGLTFTVSQGDWSNEQITSKKISMDGTYTFDAYKNRILFANVSVLTYYDSAVQRYDKNYFVNTPNFILGVSSTQSEESQTNIINILGGNSKNSFSYLGIQIGDYIALSNQKTKYLVNNIKIDEEGKEIVTVLGSIPTEDRRTKITDVVLYVDNLDSTNIKNYSETKIGKCTVSRDGIILCIDNQTEQQCQLRKNSKLNQTSSFIENAYCTQLTDVSRDLSPTEKLTIIAEQNNRLLSQIQSQPISTSNRRFI